MPVHPRQALVAMVGIALAVAAVTLYHRVRAEQANRTVAIAVDFNRVQELAGMTGADATEVLRRLRGAGATHVAIREDNLGDLLQEDRIRLRSRGNGVELVLDAGLRERVVGQLMRRLPGGVATRSHGLAYPSVRTIDLVRQMGVGYPEEAVAAARAAGLRIVVRPVGEMAVTTQAIDASLDAAQAIGADVAVFAGVQVFGVYDLIKYAAEQMAGHHLAFGWLEMGKQFGEDRLAAALKGQLVRCHAVAAEEMIKVAPQRAIDRFGLAVAERNVRLCYVRPYSLGSPDPVGAAVQYVAAIKETVCRSGYQLGVPRFYPPLRVSRVAVLLMLIGVGAATLLLVHSLWGLCDRALWWLTGVGLVVCVGAVGAALGLAQSVAALGAATVFPILALLRIHPGEAGGRASLGRGIVCFLTVSAISLAGGLLAAGCISDLAHMLQIAAFRGVKLAQVIPLLVVTAVFAARGMKSYAAIRTEMGPDLPEWPALQAGIVEAALGAVRYWHVGLIVVGMALAALMLMRSGNITPVPPSDVELKVRAFLESTLIVRPRSKEIFLGHPALILTLAFALAGWRRGLWAGMLLGAVGQVSLVNTFGHIHTPLVISLVRVANGLWLGIAAAAVFWLLGLACARVCRRPPRGTPDTPVRHYAPPDKSVGRTDPA